jgi:uncharacterized membrane protein YuzA (DUF378 family)
MFLARKFPRARKMSALRAVSDVLLVAGGLNWGILAATDSQVNVVDRVTGGNKLISNVIYGAVGVAAAYTVFDNVKNGFPRSDRRRDGVVMA